MTRCQLCARKEESWNIQQATFNVGTLQNYKLMLCGECTQRVEDTLIPVLAIRRPQAPVLP